MHFKNYDNIIKVLALYERSFLQSKKSRKMHNILFDIRLILCYNDTIICIFSQGGIKMDKQTVIQRIKDVGIVAVVRAENADKAMKILRLGYNRNKFFELTKEYGIENYKVNNAPLGYKISEIERLDTLLKAQNKVLRERKTKKKGQTKQLFDVEMMRY